MAGILSQVPLCEEPAAALGECPQSALLGSATVDAGAGTRPFSLVGSMYLTGPYKGAPFGLSVVIPSLVGPFDLGTIVLRAQVEVAPNDAHLTIVTDPLPQILSGVPLRLRTVNLTVNRPSFILNPTNCSPMAVAAQIESGQGTSFTASSPFQVSGCRALPFAPKLAAATLAKAGRSGNGASLDVKLTNTQGTRANLASLSVELPRALKARLTTVQQACLAATFAANPGSCPPASIVGSATVDTPILATPLTGPVYLVFYHDTKYPELAMVLQGSGVELQLVGTVNVNRGIDSTTFRLLPDVPIDLFKVDLTESAHSVLGAVASLCAKRQNLLYTIVGQNGAESRGGIRVAVEGCHARAARVAGSAPARRVSRVVRSARRGGRRT